MINKEHLREVRDQRGYRKAMNRGDSWTMLTLEINRTEYDGCYYEVCKDVFFTKDGKKDAISGIIATGECCWSADAFDNHLSPIWEELIADHKADDYYVDDWNDHPELDEG